MEQTGIIAGAPAATNGQQSAPANGPPSRPARAPKSLARRALETVADLRITVTLFVLSLLLVFWGTLAQQDRGTWTAVSEFFRSFLVFVPLDVALLKPIFRFSGHFDAVMDDGATTMELR